MADELPEIPVTKSAPAQKPLPEIPVTKAPAASSGAAPSGHSLPQIPVATKPNSNPFSQIQASQKHAGQVLGAWESAVWGHWKEALGAGVGADLDVLGTPQRIVSGEVENVQNHKGFLDSVEHLNDIIWHPTTEKVNKARTAVQKGLHLSTDADIDTMMHGTLMHHLGQLSPYVGNALKTVNNVATDTITDPFSVAGDAATAARDLGLAHRIAAAPSATHLLVHAAKAAAVNPATKPLIHAGVTAGRMVTAQVHNLLTKHGAGPAFEHLKTAVAATKNSASNIHRGLVDTFVTRPDLLRAGLTHAGRDVRLQLENSQRVLKHKDFTKDAAVVNDANKSVQRYAEYVHLHGSSKRSAAAKSVLPQSLHSASPPSGSLAKTHSAAEIRAMSPDERTEAFNSMRNEIHKNELARRSTETFSQQGGTKLSHTPNAVDWHKYQSPDVKQVAGVAKTMANLGRAGIELNPLPHGGTNVGTLQFLGGGLDAVTRGVGAMIKPVDHAVKGRLIQMGSGTPDYIGGHTGGIPGYAQMVNHMSGILGQMEYGWRAGMLEHLDRVLGPSEAGSKAEYIKGALINKKLGDYHNQHAFARAFASWGGPFVMYKLGILPKAVFDSIKENPIRFQTVARTEDQLQDNRQGAGQDKLSFSDPVSEARKGVMDPTGYAFDTLSLAREGLELKADWENPSNTYETFDQGIARVAENHIAPLGAIQGISDNLQGKSFAGQPMNFTDHMAAMIIGALNGHIHHKASGKMLRKNQKYISKHAFTPED
jgi:hypothetical protein